MYTQQGKDYIEDPEQLLHTIAAILPSNHAKLRVSEDLHDTIFCDDGRYATFARCMLLCE